MRSPSSLLRALQHGNSFFPGGGNSFSWGLETLIGEHAIESAGELAQFIEGQLSFRWATCDRSALAAAHRAANSLLDVAKIDDAIDAFALSGEMREGARRAGGALLDVHVSLGTPGAAEYRALVRAGQAHAQLAVVQGLVWYGVGLSEAAACAVSGHLVCAGYVGAAIRLGLIGHISGQTILADMSRILTALLAEAPPSLDEMSAYSPATEIATMRHETGCARMFAN
jgi:urease accessory protein